MCCRLLTLQRKFIFIQCILMQHIVTSRVPGELNPTRIELKIGESANITCTMNLERFSGENSSSLYFVDQESGKRVRSLDVVILNSTTIVYMLRNALSQNKQYVCKSSQNAIGLVKVYVGTEPKDVEDFKCRGYDFAHMVCNFTIPSNTILTQYNLSYTAQSPNYMQMCELEIHEGYGFCNLTLDKNNYRPNYEFYNFTLTGHNSLGTNRQNFWINHYESVIPPRPEIQFEQVTDTSVVLSWQLVKYSYYNSRGLQYEIRIRPEEFEWQNHSNSEIRNSKFVYKINLRNLPYAYYWYTVSVRVKMRSARNDDTMWSERFVGKFQTNPRLPESPPISDVGSFYMDSTEIHIRLYWRQVESYHRSGPNFKYIVKSVKRDGEQIEMLPLYIDNISAAFVLDKNHYYEFVLKSRNDIGESLESSRVIVVPLVNISEDKIPKWIRNIYHAPNQTYTLSWNLPVDHENLVDFTVFWCAPKHATLNECRSPIQFEHISKNKTQFTKITQKEEHALNFAVSANYRDYSTGMYWAMCTADVASDLVKLEPEIEAVSARAIQVLWSPDRVCPSLVEGYNITYCTVETEPALRTGITKCSSVSLIITIEKTARKHLLTNLKPFTNYKVEMYMISKLKRGIPSDPIVVQTFEEAPTPPRKLNVSNITSNSAWISWMTPSQLNGNIRHYVVIQNNEKIIINCNSRAENICSKNKGNEITFKMKNLSSFTDYKVYVIAHTVADSRPSSDVHFRTLIGIPSNPRQMVPLNGNHTIIQWAPPLVPSGRVEFYEVAVVVWYKDIVQRKRISGVVGSTTASGVIASPISCIVEIPVCPNTDYKHTLHVRAINAAERHSEVDHNMFASNYTADDSDVTFYKGNDDLECVGTLDAEADQMKQRATIERYRNRQKFKLYKSVWENGPTYGCAATNGIILLVLLLTILALGIMMVIYFARSRYNKMANITCSLPPGLDVHYQLTKQCDVDSTITDRAEEDDLHRSKESLFINEKHRLLASICSDPDYFCGGTTSAILDASASCSIGKSSGYISSERSDNYSTRMRIQSSQPTDAETSYLIMSVLKSEKVGETMNSKPNVLLANNNDYIKSAIVLRPATVPIIPSCNGYIKPNKLFQWQPQSDSPISKETNKPDTIGEPELVSTSHLDKAVAAKMCKDFRPSSSPISGYVTQQDMSTFGQQRIS